MADRPRDRLGRPLPANADPTLVTEPVVNVAAMTDVEAWTVAIDYLDRGLPFHAHDVFEQRWRQCPASEREAWRGLAQWGAALTHEARGNPTGAARLAERAQGTLRNAGSVPSVIDRERVRLSCEGMITQYR